MGPQAKIGEAVLYKPMKTVTQDEAKARWKHEAWLRSLAHTSDPMIGTDDGVVKCRSIAPLAENPKRDPEFLNTIK